jgi:putative peptidoglycan lipid II flippase
MSATGYNTSREPSGAAEDAPGPPPSAGVMRDSLAGSVWTVVSRLTGLGKALTIGAVLGATYLGNTYQAINALPNLVYYQLLAGSLFASLLVPPLIGHLHRDDRPGARVLVRGFLGSLLLVGALASTILVAVGPVIMRLLTLGVADPATAAGQRRVGWLLLVMFVPQILLYVVAGTGAAVMNADGRFALAAAAPALESIGMIAVLVTAGILFGTGTGILEVSNRQLLLLGLGTTSAVGAHAVCQWWGARSSGLTMIPGAGWRSPEVRQVLHRIVPTLGFTGLAALQVFAVLVVASKVSGGLVAFQLALNFFYLPTAVVAWPVARALLPQLSRLHQAEDRRQFANELLRSVVVASFVTIPIAAVYAGLAAPLAQALAFGELASGGWHLTALSLASLSLGVVGETWFILGTYVFYARQDVRSPVRSMAVRVAVTLSLMAVAWLSRGPSVLVILGLALSVGSLVGAADIGRRLREVPRGEFPLLRSLIRTVLASLVMVAVARATLWALRSLPNTKPAQLITVSVAVLTGAAVFLGVQAAWHAPELGWLRSGLTRRGSGGGR